MPYPPGCTRGTKRAANCPKGTEYLFVRKPQHRDGQGVASGTVPGASSPHDLPVMSRRYQLGRLGILTPELPPYVRCRYYPTLLDNTIDMAASSGWTLRTGGDSS